MINKARELPSVSLLCFSFTPKDVNEHQASKEILREAKIHRNLIVKFTEIKI